MTTGTIAKLGNESKMALPISELIAQANREAEQRAVDCRPVTLSLLELAKSVNERRL
jgi:hypothetical protein